jgi:hypothetical protein
VKLWRGSDGTTVLSLVVSDGSGAPRHVYRVVRGGRIIGEFATLSDVSSIVDMSGMNH